MKRKFISTAVAIATFLSSSTVFAQQVSVAATEISEPRVFNARVEQPDASKLKFKVSVFNPTEQKVTVKVIDWSYGVINTKVISNSEYFVLYDLSDLNDGNYRIEVIAGDEKIQQDILINTVVEENRVATFKAVKKKPVRLLGF